MTETTTAAPEAPAKQRKTLIEVNPQLHAQLKSKAALTGKPLKEVTEEALKLGMGLSGNTLVEVEG